MGRAPCCDKANVKKGPWSPEEDAKLKEYIDKQGTGGNWIALPKKAGLKRCGKSCRLRWLNYLRPNIKHGEFTDDEDRMICHLYANIGSRWSIIAAQLPGRTDNDIKNYWNTKLKKKLMGMIIDANPPQRKPQFFEATSFSSLLQASSPLPPSPTIPSLLSPPPYNCNNGSFYTLSRSLTEHISCSSSHPNTNSFTSVSNSMLQQFQESYAAPTEPYQVKDSLLMLGGDQASCSSSDGSCSNQFSHAKELDYEYGGTNNADELGLQNYFCNEAEETQKLMLSNGWNEKQNGLWRSENPLDYGVEEIKQLISSSSSSHNCLFAENKTQERVMYY